MGKLLWNLDNLKMFKTNSYKYMKLVYGILVGAKFGDRFLTRNGSLALYLWKNEKEGHFVQLETPKTPVHYDNDGRLYGSEEENENDIVYKLK